MREREGEGEREGTVLEDWRMEFGPYRPGAEELVGWSQMFVKE